MANLTELDEYPAGIYQIEQTDPVVGGAPNEATGAGMDNIPHLQLAKRTKWLKTRVDQLMAGLVAATTATAGIVQLSSATNSTSNTTAATPSAVKAANDNAETRALKATIISVSGLASGGGNLGGNRTIDVPVATQAEAEAGTLDTKAMTPLKVAQSIAQSVSSGALQAGAAILTAISTLASNGILVRTAAGLVAARTIIGGTGITLTNGNGVAGNPTVELTIATQAEAEAGTLDTKAMTPLKVAQSIAQSASSGVLQAGAAILTAISTLATNGILVRTAAGVVAARTIIGGNGITLTNGNGVAGNPTVELTIATQAEAEAGNVNTKAMTPLRVADAINAQSLGGGQVWSDVSATRAVSTNYRNTTGRAIHVAMVTSGATRAIEISQNGTTWLQIGTTSAAAISSCSFIVPDGYYYRINGACSIASWAEMR